MKALDIYFIHIEIDLISSNLLETSSQNLKFWFVE